ncbi:SDR family NAD(P)-dependent oxidoreductase [Pseudomonas sp. BF-R-19]|uniref:SDR family NAD(P)-dependent oxidoreductase n=1 Tax=Pseudomonas sp. BF-R-19 TaxID=2832397 RepID=UPI001CC0FBB9|nr:SDR family oxidoreductase [Pseudomonas sp. BF-R-19]
MTESLLPSSAYRSILEAHVKSEFDGLYAVVTGGVSGIGAATAKSLLERGCEVTVTYLTEEEAADFARTPGADRMTMRKLDVTDSAGVALFFSSLQKLDILVNCAGVAGRPEEFDEQGFLRTMDVNLNGTMRCCYAAKDLLVNGGGAIVNIASMMSFFGSGTSPGYAASKGAVGQFTRSLAVSWAEHGIRVNALAPGFTDTPMTKSLQADAQWSTKVLARTPMQRWGTPEEMAIGIVFLASPQSSFVTGVILPVDGGYMVKAVS